MADVPGSNNHPVHQHEHSDVSARGIVWSLVILAASGILLHFLMTGMWWFFGKTAAPKDPVSPWSGPRELPPAPRLQVAPRIDLENYVKSERERLNSYGVDAETKAVHIPIERAMELLEQRGLPTRKVSSPPGSGVPSHGGSGGAGIKGEHTRAP